MTDYLNAKPCKFNLRFSPYAWAKLLYLRDIGDTEVGMYGITSTEDPMLITDVKLVKQECTSVTVELDTEDSGKFVERMLDDGLAPWQCQNIWIHTHPGSCPKPSSTDEDNFKKNFSHPNWAIFFILAEGGQTWCEVQFNVGPTCRVTCDYSIVYNSNFQGTDEEGWKAEYDQNVTEQKWNFTNFQTPEITFTHSKTPDKNAKLFNHMERSVEECPTSDMASVATWLTKCGFSIDEIMAYEEYSLGGMEEVTKLDTMNQDMPMWYGREDEDCFWEDGKVWYWDQESDEFYLYDPKKNKFYVQSTGHRYKPKKGEKWVNKVIAFAKNGNKLQVNNI